MKRWTIYVCTECGMELGASLGHMHSDHVTYYAAPVDVIPLDEAINTLISDETVLAVEVEQESHRRSVLNPVKAGLHLAAERLRGEDR